MVSIEAEAQKDLALDTQDAEGVLGGVKKKKKPVAKKPAAARAAAKQPLMVTYAKPAGPVSTDQPDSYCDDEDPGLATQ
jgi:hypothetical protein